MHRDWEQSVPPPYWPVSSLTVLFKRHVRTHGSFLIRPDELTENWTISAPPRQAGVVIHAVRVSESVLGERSKCVSDSLRLSSFLPVSGLLVTWSFLFLSPLLN
ncbi:hypothetical protein NPIL_72031 [Nephila pilipes]|uniref:Uncharacterized protein n=1 Tax=Nephila pilipes TaxID=299642 RepID=A0A8X6THH3_NEPPI|nr:hypothetical protein NPIL_72031 [Nephila pilipes]